MLYQNILHAIGNTPLVRLGHSSPKPSVNIYAKLEGHNPTGSLKDRIALYMIDAAEESGELTPDKTILEATSGNTGISLAMVARVRGYALLSVLPDFVTPEREQLLGAFGAEVVYAKAARSTNDAIYMAQRMLGEEPDRYYMPDQFGNEANPRAHYLTTGAEIVRDLPQVDAFVAGLGTGGTLTGVGRRLKEHNPDIKVVAAVPCPGDPVQGLRSLEEGFLPSVLDESVLDDRILTRSRPAFAATKELMEREGIYAGISSGAVMLAAQQVAEQMDRGNIVVLLADGGWKYLSTHLWTKAYEEPTPEETEGKVW